MNTMHEGMNTMYEGMNTMYEGMKSLNERTLKEKKEFLDKYYKIFERLQKIGFESTDMSGENIVLNNWN